MCSCLSQVNTRVNQPKPVSVPEGDSDDEMVRFEPPEQSELMITKLPLRFGIWDELHPRVLELVFPLTVDAHGQHPQSMSLVPGDLPGMSLAEQQQLVDEIARARDALEENAERQDEEREKHREERREARERAYIAQFLNDDDISSATHPSLPAPA